MKKFTKVMLVSGVTLLSVTVSAVNYLYARSGERVSDLTLANIEALAEMGEGGPTMMGCKYKRHATCYIFDGDGDLVDRRKNEYPGN